MALHRRAGCESANQSQCGVISFAAKRVSPSAGGRVQTGPARVIGQAGCATLRRRRRSSGTIPLPP